jgi:hypothetical protein
MLNALIKMNDAPTSQEFYDLLLQSVCYDMDDCSRASVNLLLMQAWVELRDQEREYEEKKPLTRHEGPQAEKLMREIFFKKLQRPDSDSEFFQWPESLEYSAKQLYPYKLLRDIGVCQAEDYLSSERAFENYLSNFRRETS